MNDQKQIDICLSVKLRDDATVEKTEGRIVLTRAGRKSLEMPDSPLVERLLHDWITEEEIDRLAESASDPAAAHYLCAKLFSRDILQARCTADGEPLFSLIPAPEWSEWREDAPLASFRLSSSAHLRREGNAFVLEVPLSRKKCLLHDTRCLTWLMKIAKRSAPQPDESAGFALLHRALHLTGAYARDEEADSVWEPHDLMFFHQSSLGFHDDPIGATWRLEGKILPAPYIKPVTGNCVPLPESDGQLMERLSAPFARVLSVRRTGRIPGDRPVTLSELGALLHLSARVQKVREDPQHNFPSSFRPSPSGGAIHSLEIYPLIHHSVGFARGAWRYDPMQHRLESIPANDRLLDAYLRANPHAAVESAGLPHVRLVITSRFAREAWKYEKIAYRMVLQDLGCLYQTLSLTAEALGLASCILGAVDAKILGEILTLEPLVEPVIGEMTLSSR